jgi:hypothetical protein
MLGSGGRYAPGGFAISRIAAGCDLPVRKPPLRAVRKAPINAVSMPSSAFIKYFRIERKVRCFDRYVLRTDHRRAI